ncbi:uncharacterized protein LOC131223077 isoform X2 [Magnolia sinica]|uniref:uncharacterized protein LOC131223077 isoform X2 n=1 Tax=Magnolia sinica TaxID=86752 RepID=UPI00265AFB9C|nr:uncharacterized protein LOC131223077 isoform X2 [Magnolia sinica]
MLLKSLRLFRPLPSNRHRRNISASSSSSSIRNANTADIAKYREAFARRMVMAGIKPHHRIALGVSGGPDSIALCILALGWKKDAMIGMNQTSDYIDGLFGIVVDHRLRSESTEEANHVRNMVYKMGIRCEIAYCDWLEGRPKTGHLQEAAREMRYQLFQEVCIRHQIGVLLIAHHADDQAELFILRLSRNSGILGLAGMAFTSQLFPPYLHCYGKDSANHGILLVRPLLDFSKEDMYKICEQGGQEWVEDPTNQNPLFARNRIRMSLRNLSTSIFRSELQAVISACRKARSYIDQICCNLIDQAVTIMVHGYVIIDLEKLDPSNVEDLCLSKFVALVLQFVSQRQRPVRGSTLQSLLNYIRNFPCKTALTAAGCYLCAAPGSKGTKILVCWSPDSPLPSKMRMELSHKYSFEGQQCCLPSEIGQIIVEAKSYSDRLLPDASDVPFLHLTSSESIPSEARKLNLLSESTHETILSLQMEESKNFSPKTELKSEHELRHHEMRSTGIPSVPLQSGQSCHFMNRFLVMWKVSEKTMEDRLPAGATDFDWDLKEMNRDYICRSCIVGQDRTAVIRHMADADWLYLSKLSKGQMPEEFQKQGILPMGKINHKAARTMPCSDYVQLSAQRALRALKSIPVSARRGLPVLVDPQGLLLSIPSICFKHCPNLSALAIFKPRVPLGGGYSSYI